MAPSVVHGLGSDRNEVGEGAMQVNALSAKVEVRDPVVAIETSNKE